MRVNPFYQRPSQQCSPVVWSEYDFAALVKVDPSLHACRRERGLSIAGITPVTQMLKYFYQDAEDESPDSKARARLLRAVIDGYARTVGSKTDIPIANGGGSELEIGDTIFHIPYYSACAIDGIPVFQITDRPLRLQARGVANDSDEDYILDDEFATDIDPLDLAALLSLANAQSWIIHPPNGVHKTWHVLFPIDYCRKMVIITGLVPAATLTALKEGLQTLEPIIINREVIDVSIDVSRSEESELFKLISTFIDEGVELLQYRWRPKMVEHDLNDENDALDESDDDFLDQ